MRGEYTTLLFETEKERLDTILSTTKKAVVVMENLRNGLKLDKLFEIDIKVGFKSASRQELITHGHSHPLFKRESHRLLDAAYRSSVRGWRIEGITVNGKKVCKSKLRLAFSADQQLQRFISLLPNNKQKFILDKIKNISEQLKPLSQDFIGSSILIVTDSTEKSECKVHLIDFAHALPKKDKDNYPEVARAISYLHARLNALIEI